VAGTQTSGIQNREVFMRRFTLLCCAGLLILGAGWIAAADASDENRGNGTLKVVIGGMKSEKGDAKVALFNSKESFEGSGPAFRLTGAEIKNGRSECEFSDIPFGAYAVKVYHDENGNGKLDKNAMGQPRERYGFSNNARNTFGPPGYDRAKFLFEKADTAISITVE
jgi:uncharacterized protein (DUF2141 family)